LTLFLICCTFVLAVDLNEDTLEDLLTYDDQFLDYFNAFLQLPVSRDSRRNWISLETSELLSTHKLMLEKPFVNWII